MRFRTRLTMLAAPNAVLIILSAMLAFAQPATPIAPASPADSSASPAVFVGAGDISSCNNDHDEETARVLDGIEGTVFTLGDNAYGEGTAEQFADCYDPTWGRHRDRTQPVPGNHEYRTEGAGPYFDYFGEKAGDPDLGYYSFDLGGWHIVALNTNCDDIDGCEKDSAQVEWLREDLAAHPAQCTLAYGHHPRFSSGEHGNDDEIEPLWDTLYEGGVDVVLAGHDHTYERFAPQDPTGAPDPEHGIREFVVGTGGAGHYDFENMAANSEIRDNTAYGVLKLTLDPTGYAWEFVPIEGDAFTDSGSGTCH